MGALRRHHHTRCHSPGRRYIVFAPVVALLSASSCVQSRIRLAIAPAAVVPAHADCHLVTWPALSPWPCRGLRWWPWSLGSF